MRLRSKRAVLFGVALALVACRTRPFDQPLGADGDLPQSSDLAQSIDLARSIDLAQSIDLAPTPCAAAAQCAADVIPNDLQSYKFCFNGHVADAFIFPSLGACAATWCQGFVIDPDLGPGKTPRCVTSADTTTYVDAPGVPAGDCRVCLVNAFSAILGIPCPASDPACANWCGKDLCTDPAG